MERLLILILAGVVSVSNVSAGQLWQDVCTQPDVKSTKWCDTSAPIKERAAAFVAALTVDEKVPIMTNEASGVKRLHIPPYQWGSGKNCPNKCCCWHPLAVSIALAAAAAHSMLATIASKQY